MEITYESIRPYILEEKVEGSKVLCKFQIDNQVFESAGYIKMANNDGKARVTRMVTNTALGRLRSTVLRVLRKAVGGGFAGTAVSMAGNEVMRQGTDGFKHSKKDKEKAVIAAFEKIAIELAFESGKWRLATEFSEFEKLIKRNPFKKSYDKKILARMLVEMARADGKIEAEEKAFFDDFLNEETGSLGELMRAPSISVVECEEVSPESRENVFMIVAAVALTDNEFADEEQLKLDEYSQMFEFSETKQEELLRYAQDYTIESYIRANGEMSRDEIYAFADKIGMDRGEAERTQIRLEKRLN
ncbi:tellurite resistance TerB family protein [Aureispira anguillae]|uniref:TerB family tellurite resistance protein n=1 Tax=Aureispira anguillae TaxID=2864201 RepID=A0A915YII4_9BACT|nr:TerB family tellurite resistance protein [Aureispira anguillae]BDS13503.1 TerB family tellurite resistance protein [Aureispira anguillae]